MIEWFARWAWPYPNFVHGDPGAIYYKGWTGLAGEAIGAAQLRMYPNAGNCYANTAIKRRMGLEIGILDGPSVCFHVLRVQIVMIAHQMAMSAFSCPISGDRVAQLPCACSRRVYLAHCYGRDYWLCMAVSSVTSTEGDFRQYTLPVIP